MGKKFKKGNTEVISFGKKKESLAPKSKIPFHLDDKGRRVFDLDKKLKKIIKIRKKRMIRMIKMIKIKMNNKEYQYYIFYLYSILFKYIYNLFF